MRRFLVIGLISRGAVQSFRRCLGQITAVSIGYAALYKARNVRVSRR